MLNLPEAYALQSAVSALRIAAGEHVIGYKIGCTGPGTVAQFGMKGPIRAYLYDSEIHRSGERLNSADFANLAVEAEMALRLGDDGRVAAAFPVIELHHFVFPGGAGRQQRLERRDCLARPNVDLVRLS